MSKLTIPAALLCIGGLNACSMTFYGMKEVENPVLRETSVACSSEGRRETMTLPQAQPAKRRVAERDKQTLWVQDHRSGL